MTLTLSLPSPIDSHCDRIQFYAPIGDYPLSYNLFVLDTGFERIHHGEATDIYRATLHQAPPDGHTNIVCKIAYGTGVMKLVKEARIYKRLVKLQGEKIPSCYGFFASHVKGTLGCLVLEYCGESLEQSWIELPREIKLRTMDAFFAVHKAGVQHNDLTQRNVLWDGTRVRVISLGNASNDHFACNVRKPACGENAADRDYYGCNELWDLLTELGLWVPDEVLYGGQNVLSIFAGNPRYLVEYARPPYWTKERAMREAYIVVKEFTRKYFPWRHEGIVKEGAALFQFLHKFHSTHYTLPGLASEAIYLEKLKKKKAKMKIKGNKRNGNAPEELSGSQGQELSEDSSEQVD